MSWEINEEGWLTDVARVASPNFDARPADESPSLLVIHAISLPPNRFGSDDILKLFTNTLDPLADPYFAGISHLRVSAHFLVRRTGEVLQFVSCRQRAWHAGVSQWQGRERCNDFSIGIELEGCDELPFEDCQYLSLRKLVMAITGKYAITAIVGHSDIAPGRKTDPGPCFRWQALVDHFPNVVYPSFFVEPLIK